MRFDQRLADTGAAYHRVTARLGGGIERTTRCDDQPAHTFNPADSVTIRQPERPEPGFWVGCPSVLVDGDLTWLTYRERRPRGATAERGWRCAVAVSPDGLRFEDVWEVHKDELDSPSMERFDLTRTDHGYELFVSYVDPADGRWRIDLVTASRPEDLDVATRRPGLTADSTATEGMKDPVVVEIDGSVHLYASYAPQGLRSTRRLTLRRTSTTPERRPTRPAWPSATDAASRGRAGFSTSGLPARGTDTRRGSVRSSQSTAGSWGFTTGPRAATRTTRSASASRLQPMVGPCSARRRTGHG
jgi:hypothetical protein